MTDIHAALGISQLKRIEEFIKMRHKVADIYNNLLKELPLKLPYQSQKSKSSFHLYIIRLKADKLNISHKEFFESMRNNGIGVNLHYIPVHLHPFYEKFGFKKGDFPESEKYYSEAISLPIFPNLSHKDQHKIVDVISNLLNKN
jgi:dTDP-4-amino-4,6-dideoxygalactose transaminase